MIFALLKALPFSPFTALRVAGAVVALAGLAWIIDEIGDRREAKVYRRINAAIEKTNVDVRHLNSLDEKMSAIAEDARQKALSGVKPSDRKATAEEAAQLTKVR